MSKLNLCYMGWFSFCYRLCKKCVLNSYCILAWIKWIFCITWKNPKLATSCNLRVVAFKVIATQDFRDLYGNKIQGLTSLAFMFYLSLSSSNSSRSPSAMLKLYINTNLDRVFWMIPVYFLPKNQSCKLQKLESRLVRPSILFPFKSLWNSSNFETFTAMTQIAGCC